MFWSGTLPVKSTKAAASFITDSPDTIANRVYVDVKIMVYRQDSACIRRKGCAEMRSLQ